MIVEDLKIEWFTPQEALPLPNHALIVRYENRKDNPQQIYWSYWFHNERFCISIIKEESPYLLPVETPTHWAYMPHERRAA